MAETHVNKTQYERIPSLGETSSEDTIQDNSVEKATFFVYYLVFCVCIGGFLFGYDTGGTFTDLHLLFMLTIFISVISGALLPIQVDFIMTTRQKELVVSATTFGAIFSGFFAGLVM